MDLQPQERTAVGARSYYERHRARILANHDAKRRALGKLVGRGGPGRGAGRKKKPALGTFVCANAHCGAERARRRQSPHQRFCSQRCQAIGQAASADRRRRGGVIHTWRECANCHEPFHPKLAKQRHCGTSCARAWVIKTFTNPLKPEILRARRRLACAKRRANGFKVHVGRWRRICERDQWACWICEKAIDRALLPPHRLSGTADHYVPLSRGGSDDDSNLRAAHLRCNSKRCAGRVKPAPPVAA